MAVEQVIDVAARQNVIHIVARVHGDRAAVEGSVQRALVRRACIRRRGGDRLDDNLTEYVLPRRREMPWKWRRYGIVSLLLLVEQVAVTQRKCSQKKLKGDSR